MKVLKIFFDVTQLASERKNSISVVIPYIRSIIGLTDRLKDDEEF